MDLEPPGPFELDSPFNSTNDDLSLVWLKEFQNNYIELNEIRVAYLNVWISDLESQK